MYRYLIVFALAVFLSPMALADITGQPRVIDGDTLDIDGQRTRFVLPWEWRKQQRKRR